jgi:hypothetical protein
VVNAGYRRPTINDQPTLRTWRVIVDEFHQLAGDQFAEIIEQLRKYQVFPVIAHQNLSQLSERLLTAATSCGVRFFLRVAPDDQAMIRRLFGTEVSDGLATLPDHTARLQLPRDPTPRTIALADWWAARDERQLATAVRMGDDDRYTVRVTPSETPSERHDGVSDTAARPRPTLLDRFEEEEDETHVAATTRPPHPSRSRRRAPVAAQTHPARDRDLARDRPGRLFDEFAD